MNNEKNPPLHLEIAQLNSELDIEEPLDGETLSLPSSKRTHPETELGNEESKQTSLLLYEAPELQTCLTIEETTNVDSIQNLRNEFTLKKMWTTDLYLGFCYISSLLYSSELLVLHMIWPPTFYCSKITGVESFIQKQLPVQQMLV